MGFCENKFVFCVICCNFLIHWLLKTMKLFFWILVEILSILLDFMCKNSSCFFFCFEFSQLGGIVAATELLILAAQMASLNLIIFCHASCLIRFCLIINSSCGGSSHFQHCGQHRGGRDLVKQPCFVIGRFRAVTNPISFVFFSSGLWFY